MSLRTALIVDVTSLYFDIQSKYPGKRLRLLDFTKAVEEMGHNLTFKIAYSKQAMTTAQTFAHLLASNGYETHFGTNSWNVALAIRAIQVLPAVDALVIGTSTDEFWRVFEYARALGKVTKCVSVKFPQVFLPHAECIELKEALLDDDPRKAKPVVVPGNSSSNGTQLQG